MISCKEYTQIRKKELKEKISTFSRKPCLCVIQIGDDTASNSYIKGKKRDCEEIGIEFEHEHFRDYEDFSQEDIINVIKILNECKTIDGIIIQLPIPDKYDVEELQKYISPEKDVDGFRRDSCFDSCTPKGIIDWLDYNDYDFRGKDVTVVGRSKIVGKPLVNMLIDRGATVTCCNSKTKNLATKTRMANLVVSAIGKPKYFDTSYFASGTIIVDVGINRDENGKLCGDVDKEQIDNACLLGEVKGKDLIYVTPSPGGVGLLTRLSLLENTIRAYEMNVYYK